MCNSTKYRFPTLHFSFSGRMFPLSHQRTKKYSSSIPISYPFWQIKQGHFPHSYQNFPKFPFSYRILRKFYRHFLSASISRKVSAIVGRVNSSHPGWEGGNLWKESVVYRESNETEKLKWVRYVCVQVFHNSPAPVITPPLPSVAPVVPPRRESPTPLSDLRQIWLVVPVPERNTPR